MPSEPRYSHIAERIDNSAGDTGDKTEGSEIQNIYIIVLLASADCKSAEHTRQRHKQNRLVVDYRPDTRFKARRLNGLHDTFLTDKEEPQRARARDYSGKQTHGNESPLKGELDFVSAYKVEQNRHYLFRQFFTERTGDKIGNRYQSGSVNGVRRYRRLNTLLGYRSECSCAFTHDHQREISDKFPDILLASARK